jgi:hypothetical protein
LTQSKLASWNAGAFARSSPTSTPPSVKPIDPQTVLRDRLVDWVEGLRRPPAEARHALRPLLQERLVFTPREDATGRYYEITGVGTVTPVLAGLVDTKAWCPRGDWVGVDTRISRRS